jgi:hypothetical protein
VDALNETALNVITLEHVARTVSHPRTHVAVLEAFFIKLEKPGRVKLYVASDMQLFARLRDISIDHPIYAPVTHGSKTYSDMQSAMRERTSRADLPQTRESEAITWSFCKKLIEISGNILTVFIAFLDTELLSPREPDLPFSIIGLAILVEIRALAASVSGPRTMPCRRVPSGVDPGRVSCVVKIARTVTPGRPLVINYY